jgi:hypothetical protein
MKLIKTIRNWLRAKSIKSEKEFARGYTFTKRNLAEYSCQEVVDDMFCQAYSQIFVGSYYQGVRKALSEYYQEQLKNEK